MTESSLEERILLLYKKSKWQEIIDLGANEEEYEARRLLWVWPSFSDLRWFHKNIVSDYELEGIVSVGSGSGLLEWIIQQHSRCDVIGLEVDSSWWSSKYSPPLFLQNTLFIDREKDVRLPENYALLFCYFNNGKAFRDYLRSYEGKVVVTIGPDKDINRTTDPLPFDKKFCELGWTLRKSRKLDNGKDFLVVYTK